MVDIIGSHRIAHTRTEYIILIIFFGNNDLRRILTDYGFKGHPLRKDFPLVGFLELTFDILTKTLKYIPIELSQDYRKFQFINSWENI